jgi:hypothetical protein
VLTAALAVRVALARHIAHPGLGDANYYQDVALACARGEGLTSRCLWNLTWLPPDLVHPACRYWGPGVPLILAAAYRVLGPDVRAGQAAMMLLALALTATGLAVARRLGLAPARQVAAGFLLAFHTQLAYFSVTLDTPIPFAVFANLCLLPLGLAHAGWAPGFALAVPGALAAQLTRADGVLLPLVVLGFAALAVRRGALTGRGLVLVLGLYLAGWVPWLARNQVVFGTPFPSSVADAVALGEYSDLFRVHARPSLAAYLEQGVARIAKDKLAGVAATVETVGLGENKLILAFFPFALISLARQPVAAPYIVYLAALLVAMSVAFNLQSRSGSLLHSLPALFPFLFAGSLAGLERVCGWFPRRTGRALAVAGPWLLVLYSALLLAGGLLGSGGVPALGRDARELSGALGRWWRTPGVGGPDVRLMSNDSLDLVGMLPDPVPVVQEPRDPGDAVVFDVAQRYGVRYLVHFVFAGGRYTVRAWDRERHEHAGVVLRRVAELPVLCPTTRLVGVRILRFEPGGLTPGPTGDR